MRWDRYQIAAELGCVPRHASRLVDELREAGVPVEEERNGRKKVYFIPDEHQRRTIQVEELDEAALRALVVAAEASRAILAGTSLEEPLGRAFGALLAAYRGDEYGTFEPEAVADRWHFGTVAAPGVGALATMRTLDEAIRESRSVRVTYVNGRGERSERVLDPLAVAPFPSGWQLAAWCHRRQAVRNFNPARIEAIALTDAYFSPPDGWDADLHFDGRFGALEGDGRLQTVRLRVSRTVAQHFLTRPYHSSQRIAEAGGEMEVTFQVPELQAIRAWVRSWGPAVTALEPPELVEGLTEDARQTAARYA
ncbi:MAG: WYL domain-containing protein [Bacteroidota bacterium]